MNNVEKITPDLIWRNFAQYRYLDVEEATIDNILLSNIDYLFDEYVISVFYD